MMKILKFLCLVSFGSILLSSCATYYQRSQQMQTFVQQGKLDEAHAVLSKDKKAESGKNRVLQNFNMGWVEFARGNYEESLKQLEKADLYIEDYQKNYGSEALALLTNPNVKPYAPEDPEKVMVNYYKALDYLMLGNKESALVEARKITQKLYDLNDKYKNRKNRYADDAFAHILIGLIYDASNDVNNAFIAYRNAVRVYDSIFTKQFDIQIPDQLKEDLLRTAYLNGFKDELDFYSRKFNMNYLHKPFSGGSLVFIWENGMGPVKGEWSAMFSKVNSSDGFFHFQNDELGMSFPFSTGSLGASDRSAFSDLSVFRVAFPRYLERKPVYKSASLRLGNSRYELQKAQDCNAILFKTLEDRMLREFGTSLLRLATKKAMEAALKSKDKNAGAILSIVNAVTEQADTRNWQTLPYEISYVRIPLPAGNQSIKLELQSLQGNKEIPLEVNIPEKGMVFKSYRTLETGPAQARVLNQKR